VPSYVPAYVIHSYKTVHFTSKNQLVCFFHESFGHPFLVTMLEIVSSDSIVNLHRDLTRTTVRQYFPNKCPACLAGQLSQRSPASVDNIPYTLPGETFKIDFKDS